MGMTSHKVMEIAEKLYNKGFISYPRTETEKYPNGFNFDAIIAELRNNDVWG